MFVGCVLCGDVSGGVVWLFVGGDDVDCGSKDCDGGRALRTGQGVGEVDAATRRVGDGCVPCCCECDDAPG